MTVISTLLFPLLLPHRAQIMNKYGRGKGKLEERREEKLIDSFVCLSWRDEAREDDEDDERSHFECMRTRVQLSLFSWIPNCALWSLRKSTYVVHSISPPKKGEKLFFKKKSFKAD